MALLLLVGAGAFIGLSIGGIATHNWKFIPGAVGFLLFSLAVVYLFFATTVYEITFHEDRTITFKAWLGSTTLSPEDILAVKLPTFIDKTFFYLKHRRGSLQIFYWTIDYLTFLNMLYELNPNIEYSGSASI